jgi:hypothetical protein
MICITHTHTRARARTHTHTHTITAYQNSYILFFIVIIYILWFFVDHILDLYLCLSAVQISFVALKIYDASFHRHKYLSVCCKFGFENLLDVAKNLMM